MTKEEILNPYVEKLFRHSEVVSKENALIAMEQYADKSIGVNLCDLSEEKLYKLLQHLKEVEVYQNSHSKVSTDLKYKVWEWNGDTLIVTNNRILLNSRVIFDIDCIIAP